MRALVAVACVALLCPTASGYVYWNDIRNSAELPDTTVVVRVENPTGSEEENYVLYAVDGIQEVLMTGVPDGPSTLEGNVPAPLADARRLGFRLKLGDEIDFMPVRIVDGVSPEPGELTRVATDPAGDELFGYDNLDLVDCRVSFSDTELHAALTNVGDGFPVSQFLTFFGYLMAIADPAEADPDTVFALMQTYEQAGIISPGLYKITGPATEDLVKLGEVEVTEYPALNTLVLSCQFSDLLSDPYFASWYDPSDPILGVAGFTQRITLLSGAQEADETPGGQCHLREYSIAPVSNHLPGLSNARFQGIGSTATAEIDYLDPDGNCPVISEIVFDDTLAYQLFPTSLDYSTSITYTTAEGIDPLANETWSVALFRFSDNGSDIVELEIPSTGIDEPIEDVVRLLAEMSPNPFRETASIELAMPQGGTARVAVYDLLGRRVRTLFSGDVSSGRKALEWDGRDSVGRPVGSGVYFVRAEATGLVETKKVVLAR